MTQLRCALLIYTSGISFTLRLKVLETVVRLTSGRFSQLLLRLEVESRIQSQRKARIPSKIIVDAVLSRPQSMLRENHLVSSNCV